MSSEPRPYWSVDISPISASQRSSSGRSRGAITLRSDIGPDFGAGALCSNSSSPSTAPLPAATGAINDPTSTYLTSFTAHGGRLLIYQGVSDPVFSAQDIVGWYDKLAAETGDPSENTRLFLVPGMGHCAGGPATDRFDALTALQDWVEKKSAPERLAASGAAFPGVTRPLCAYPKVARYNGGDPKQEASFACR